jgi:hypothetical protein
LTLIGAGANNTIIEALSQPFGGFRLIHVAATGDLTLEQLTIRGGGFGVGFVFFQGGGLFNKGKVSISDSIINGNHAHSGGGLYNAGGTVTLTQSILAENETGGPRPSHDGGAGIWNAPGGSIQIMRSTLANNSSVYFGGGIFNDAGGTVTIMDSSLSSNRSADPGDGGAIENFGVLSLTNSTLSGNEGGRTGAIDAGGNVTITNSTISGNTGHELVSVGGVSGIAALQNTILALNTGRTASDCSAGVISLGNNLIGTTMGCDITLQPSDVTGDPGLDAFSDDGTPGNGHYALLPTSQAIDAGNDEVCPKRDQLGQKRHSPCDIGAIEFPDRP